MRKSVFSTIKKALVRFLTMTIPASVKREITIDRLVEREVKTISLIYQTLTERGVLVRVSALTFTTLISLIPMLAFVFSLLTAFRVSPQVKEYLLMNLTLGRNDLAQAMLSSVEHTNFATLGIIGLFITFWAFVVTLASLETTINDIWGIRDRRPLVFRMSYYTTITVLFPVLILGSIGVTTALESAVILKELSRLAWFTEIFRGFMRFLPYLVVWVLFAFMYKVIPNTKVRLSSAVFGALVGGTLWQLALYFYAKFQVGLANYNLIYSSFASLPFFMFWLFVSWLMVVLGAVTAYVHQNYRRFRLDAAASSVSFSFSERLALRVFMAVASNFFEGRRPISVDGISELLDTPVHLVNNMIFILRDEGLIIAVGEDEGRYVPAKDLGKIGLVDFLTAMREHGENPDEEISKHQRPFLDETIRAVLQGAVSGYGSITFAGLCKKHAAEYLKGQRERGLPGKGEKSR
ncbi:MAG: YihY family inner membrane protein [Deltaproteobacteria bacterium]|nr:YihY family inner membrane protein [Candidatus Zymogenaceae bacterium]